MSINHPIFVENYNLSFVRQSTKFNYTNPGNFSPIDFAALKVEINNCIDLYDGGKDVYEEPGLINQMNGYISLKVQEKLSLMGVDADTTKEMDTACSWLSRNGFNYIVYNSSPDHYWIIVDFVDNIFNINRMLKRGNLGDKRYVDIGQDRNEYVFRAFPKSIIPFRSYDRIFSTHDNISTIYKLWVNEFDRYWKSGFIKEIHENMLIKALE